MDFRQEVGQFQNPSSLEKILQASAMQTPALLEKRHRLENSHRLWKERRSEIL
jgi:hypothetical protein